MRLIRTSSIVGNILNVFNYDVELDENWFFAFKDKWMYETADTILKLTYQGDDMTPMMINKNTPSVDYISGQI